MFQRRTTPSPVEEEDPVADGVEHAGGLLALRGHCAGRRLGCLQAPALLLKTRVSNGRRHLRDQPLEDLELLARVRAAVAHQLDDADHAAFVLDRHHHRRVRPCRAGLGKLLDRSLPVDVVVDAVRLA